MSDGVDYEVRLPGTKSVLDALVSGNSPQIPRKWEKFTHEGVTYLITEVEWRYTEDRSYGCTRLHAYVWVTKEWDETTS